jgi:transcriptional antiterminator
MVVASLIADADVKKRGWMAAIAKQVCVSRWTIARDVKVIRQTWQQQRLAASRDQQSRQEGFAALLEASTGGAP